MNLSLQCQIRTLLDQGPAFRLYGLATAMIRNAKRYKGLRSRQSSCMKSWDSILTQS